MRKHRALPCPHDHCALSGVRQRLTCVCLAPAARSEDAWPRTPLEARRACRLPRTRHALSARAFPQACARCRGETSPSSSTQNAAYSTMSPDNSGSRSRNDHDRQPCGRNPDNRGSLRAVHGADTGADTCVREAKTACALPNQGRKPPRTCTSPFRVPVGAFAVTGSDAIYYSPACLGSHNF